MRAGFRITLVALLGVTACTTGDAPPVVDFNTHVKPILADHRLVCHGHDAASRKSDLALHTEEGLFGALKEDSSRFVVVAHQAGASELIRRVSSPLSTERMPPPEAGPPLSEHDIATLRRWIA